MMVSSDAYDLAQIAKRMGKFVWSENLIGGVAFYGASWNGGAACLEFLNRAAELGGVVNPNICGYTIFGEKRTRNVKLPNLEKVLREDRADNPRVRSVIFRESIERVGAPNGNIVCGGQVGVYRRGGATADPMIGQFLFPWQIGGDVIARNILKVAAEKLNANLGYFFIRDEFAFPGGFVSGFCPALDVVSSNNGDCYDIMTWSKLVKDWVFGGCVLKLRDIFNVNLLGGVVVDCMMINDVTLIDWIGSGSGRGNLLQIDLSKYIWSLTDEEIENVRPTLQSVGLCVASGRHYYRSV